MELTGWIKIYRKFANWEWYKKSEMVHLFIHLIISANFKDSFWQGIKIKRGELITGRKSLSFETGISQQVIRTCLKKLESTKEIVVKSTNKYSIITICNYDIYNDFAQQDNQQLTSNQPAINQQSTSNQPQRKKNKERKEEKEIIYDNEIYDLIEFSKSYFSEKYLNENSYKILSDLVKIDKYTLSEIKNAIHFARNDSFWSSNFLSPAKLRNKDKNGVKFIDVFLAKSDTIIINNSKKQLDYTPCKQDYFKNPANLKFK